MYCPSFSTPYPSSQSCCPPNPCCPPPPCPSPCGISKLADFVHYGGRGGTSCCSPPCPPKPCCPPPPPVQRRCPPLPPCNPPCAPKSNNCKDLPAQRLRNVDVLEELCYYVPGCDPSGAMDCYTVDCCGNVEKLNEDTCNPCECPPQPVKYSRRQRFAFNDPGGNRPAYGDPWPFTDNCGGNGGGGGGRNGGDGYYGGNQGGNGGGCGGGGVGGNRRGSMNGGGGGGNNGRGIGATRNSENCCCNGRKYTYCPEDTPDCSEMLPGASGVYYFDRERRAFVPERDLPKPPEVIEKQVRVPDIEEYELLEEESNGGGGNGGSTTTYNGNGGGGGGRQTVQPVIQPIIMPSNGQCPQGTSPCQGPPPCQQPPPCCPPPCCPPPCYPPPCGPPPCNPYYPPPPCYPQPCQPPPCNPCQPCGPCCNPCCAPQCNPCCMPNCNPMMNMCGGCLPMVIPMCPQQPGGQAMGGGMGGGGGPPMMPPPPPFPFPPPFMMGGGPGGFGGGRSGKKKKRSKKSKRSKRSKRRSGAGSGSRRNTYDTVNPDLEAGAEIPTEGEEVTDHLEGEGVSEGEVIGGEEGGDPEFGQDPNAPAYDGSGYTPRGSGQSGMNPEGQVRLSGDQGQSQLRRSFGSQGQQGQQPLGFEGPPGLSSGQRTMTQMEDGTIVTTIDFPPGEAESVDVLATQRRNSKEPTIDVVAEIQGGKAGPPPAGEMVVPQGQYSTQDGGTVTTYKMPEGKDGYVSAKNL